MNIGTIKVKNKIHRIIRHGKRINQGGHGVTWTCSCGHGRCYAMVSLFQRLVDMSLVKLTVDGKRIFHIKDEPKKAKVSRPRQLALPQIN